MRNRFLSTSIITAALALSTQVGAQDSNVNDVIHLRCEGMARASKSGHESFPEQVEPISIGVDIDQSSGTATIQGLYPMARTASGDKSAYSFVVKDNVFQWNSQHVMTGDRPMTATSVIEIDRYSAKMEAVDSVVGGTGDKQFMFLKNVNASCKRILNKAF